MSRGARVLLGLVMLASPAAAMESAAALRLPDARIAAAASYSRACGGQALLVRQGGRLLHESYANGGAADRAHWAMSLTKNLAALAALAACRDGLLSLDDPAARTLPEWRKDPRKRRITIRELLDQTSGLASGYSAIYARRVRDKNQIALALPAVAEPGQRFAYGPGNYEVLEEILRRKLAPRGTDPLAYLHAKILAPLGVRPADWRRDQRGNPFFSTGAKLTARDVARLGEFVRTQGRVGFFPLLPAAALREAVTGSAANSMYGLSFWLNANARRPGSAALSIEGTLGGDRSPGQWRLACLSRDPPPELIAMIGSGGLRCYVLPARQLVIVRFGAGAKFSDAEFLRKLFGRG